MHHALQAIVDAERARQRRRVEGAETELKRLRSEPIMEPDGDADGSMAGQLQRARQIDRAELELVRAQAAEEAMRHLWTRFEEELATDRAEDMPRAVVRP